LSSSNGPALPAAWLYPRLPLILGHRGASAYAPENTLHAFSEAVARGADGFELDVSLSADGVPVVMHDDSLQRTTGASGQVAQTSLAELKKLDAGYAARFGSQFAGERIPTLAEVFESADLRAVINVELKHDRAPERRLADRVVELIHAHNMGRRVIVSSFQFSNLQRVKQLDPQLPVGVLYTLSLFAGRVQRRLAGAYAFEAHHPSHLGLSADRVQWFHDRGRRVNAWTVNKPDDLRRLMAAGIDGVITDVPDLAAQARDERAKLG
jgi:glycerophosphoryl diester phosphodiesterase